MWISYAVITAALVVVGGVGGRATEIGPWYRNLIKPSWNPPDWAFPVVWTTIYLFIIYSVGGVWNEASSAQQFSVLVVTAVNLVLNMIWSFLFFTFKKPVWALIEVVMLWLSIVAMMVVFAPISSFHAWMLLPYLVWVSVATLLNWSIIRLNPSLASA